ncbi:MAG: TIGR00268 family protein, partial [Marinilabiliaceae bacterium]
EAADQYQVKSPLADCGFEKPDIREMAQYFQLQEWSKPASPCLSSRFPYGISISKEKLKMVEEAENILNKQGFTDVRARYRHGDVSIEVPPEEIPLAKEKISALEPEFKQLGFGQITIDEEGLVSGKLNRAIGK